MKNDHGFLRLLIMGAATFGGITAANAERYYIYNGKRMPLAADPTRMAVRFKAGNEAQAVQSARAAAAAAGETTAKVSGIGLPGWAITEGAAVPEAARATLRENLQAQAGVAFTSPVLDLEGDAEAILSDAVLVKFAPGADPAATLAALGENGAVKTLEPLGDSGIFKVVTTFKDGDEVLDLANRLEGKPGIVFATPDFLERITPQLVPNDPGFGSTWGLRNTANPGFDMAATAAWDVTTGSSSVLTVVFDEGIQQNHPDLNQIAGRDFTSAPVTDGGTGTYDAHGTAVAGCIAGRINNALGTAGIAPNTRVASARIAASDSSGRWTFSYSWVINGLSWARSMGARVTNHSYGGGSPSSAMDDAFQTSRDAGLLHFAAAGNSAVGFISYPSSSPYVVSVGAAASNGTKASFSQWGTGLDFMAPGQSVYTTDETGSRGYSADDYASVNGTSFASPYAAGVAALLVSQFPAWTPDQILQRMRDTCTDMGSAGVDAETGSGLLNAYRALTGSTPPPPPPPAVDDHGNSMATASSAGCPGVMNGNFETMADEDFFRFTLSGTRTVTLTTTSTIDTYGYLLDASGNTLAQDDDSGEGYNFQLTRTLGAGTYYLRSHTYNRQYTGTYRLAISDGGSAPEIRVTGAGIEIADGTATTEAGNGTAFGTVESGGLVDRTFVIENSGTADLVLTGSPLVSVAGAGAEQFRVVSQPAGPIGAGRSSSFTVRFQPAATGSYNPQILIASNDGDEGSYDFRVSGTSTVPVDDHANVPAQATRVSPGSVVGGRIETVGDVDYFVFSLARKTAVTIRSAGNTDVVAYLFNAKGKQILFNDDGAGYPNFQLRKTLPRGTYYVRVNGISTSTTGGYGGVTFSF